MWRALAPGDSEPPGSPVPLGLAPVILVVDDDRYNREGYAEYLSMSGYRVVQARDEEEAIRQARELLPNVILMDLSLPRMDGWEATRRLKADDRTKRIPIVAITAHELDGNARERAREMGCDAFLSKPCLPQALTLQIQLALAGARKTVDS